MHYLSSPLADISDPWHTGVKQALERYYLDRLACDDDRRMACALMDAAGIGPGAWLYDPE